MWDLSRTPREHLEHTSGTQEDSTSHTSDIGLGVMSDGHPADLTPSGSTRQTCRLEPALGPEKAASLLENPKYWSMLPCFAAAWLLVGLTGFLAITELVYIHLGWSDPKRLLALFVIAVGTFPPFCFSVILSTLRVQRQAFYHSMGHYYDSPVSARLSRYKVPTWSFAFFLLATFLGLFFNWLCLTKHFLQPKLDGQQPTIRLTTSGILDFCTPSLYVLMYFTWHSLKLSVKVMSIRLQRQP